MNLADFSREFDLLYNNSLSFSAPPVNVYEKSLYLTQAQEKLVKDDYTNYEKSEKSRERLRNLVVNSTITYDAGLNSSLTTLKFNSNSKFFEVPTDVWFILSEHVNTNVQVIPTPIDEYNINITNPFKRPTTNEIAWRLDLSDSINATAKNIREILYPATITTYSIRYLKKPPPIILESLTPYSMTIEGLSAATNCILSSEIHRDIVNEAVNLAILTYEEKNLQNRIQVG